jgi:hypothetical protein
MKQQQHYSSHFSYTGPHIQRITNHFSPTKTFLASCLLTKVVHVTLWQLRIEEHSLTNFRKSPLISSKVSALTQRGKLVDIHLSYLHLDKGSTVAKRRAACLKRIIQVTENRNRDALYTPGRRGHNETSCSDSANCRVGSEIRIRSVSPVVSKESLSDARTRW